jgi:iron complex outermembrane recepter protein
MLKHRITTVSALALIAASFPALAQQAGQSGEEFAIEEIVVTAERRAANIQDVPISITATSGDSLREAAMFDSQALSSSVPGLQVQKDVVGKVVIRGIGTENFTVGGDPGVAIYSDGAYIARSSAAIFDFFDVERVEVLRGPQGTLYGRNATGGVINVINKSPGKEFEASGNLTYGNYNNLRMEAAIGGPLRENLRVRLAGLYSQRDGFTKNIFPGIGARGLDELDTKDLWAVRGRVDIDMTENLTLELTGDIYRDSSNPPAFWYTDARLPWQGPTSVYPRDIRTVSQGYETATPGTNGLQVGKANKQDQSGITGRLTYRGDDFTITSTTAYRDISFDWINDGDGLSDYLVVYFQRDQSEQFSQDLQIASAGDGPFSWIVGATYLTEDSKGVYAIPLGPAFGGFTIVYDGTNKTDAYGVFAEGTYKWGALSFTAGVRYSNEVKNATLRFTAGATQPLQRDRGKYDAVTPRFVIKYDLNEDANVYVSATNGFKSGGFSLLDFPINDFGAEKIWAFEAGVKSRLMDRRVQFNASVFYYDYSDQQLSQVTTLATTTTNAGSSTIWGIETEFSALLTKNFKIDGNLAYLNAEFDKFCTNDSRNTTRPLDRTNCATGTTATPNLAGFKLPRSPDVTANLAGTYSAELSDSLVGSLRAEWQLTGKQFFSVFNRPNIAQGSYSLFNASAGVEDADGRWNLRVWVRNLTDKTYFTNLFESGVTATAVVPQGFVGAPRTFGVTGGFKF